MSKEYKLSATLLGHSLDVRSIQVTAADNILSGSRDKTAKYWSNKNFQRSYNEIMTYRDQKNFVASVLYLEPTNEYPDGLVITGGNDNIILVYKPSEPFASFTIKEHTNTVCCLNKGNDKDCFLSGSWDTSVKVWKLSSLNQSVVTLNGHTAAVWAVLQQIDSRILTASADKTIGVWDMGGQRLNTITGHTDCVRGLLDFPDQSIFMSVSNDASIKVWNYAGENIDTYYGHTNYIYSIARCKKGGETCFVTSDEDRTVRVWNNGQNTHKFSLPAQSVWAVDCLSNGDVVTGSSDGVVRIFTLEESRLAETIELTKFNEEVEALSMQNTQEIGGVKVTDLPGREALYDPGKKAGQMKMIRESGSVIAYTWVEDGDNSHWDKVGEVLGGTDKDQEGKTTFEGQSYDYVFTVDVEDGKPPLKLPYNKGEDPYQVANKFLLKNNLPASYLEQVVDFILKNSQETYVPAASGYVDPYTGVSRYTPRGDQGSQSQTGMNVDPFTGGSSYSTSSGPNPYLPKPSTVGGANADPLTGGSSYCTAQNGTSRDGTYFPLAAYRSFDVGNPEVVINKLKEFNEKAGEKIEDVHFEKLKELCKGPCNDPEAFEIVFKLLTFWPDDYLFPVLDIIRISVKHKLNNQHMASNNILIEKLKHCISEKCKVVNDTVVSLRVLCNLMMHDFGEKVVVKNYMDILEQVTSLRNLNKNGEVALTTFLLNLVILAIKENDYIGISILAEVIPDISSNLNDVESQFRLYVALGTLLLSEYGSKKEIKTKINGYERFKEQIDLHILSGGNELEIKRKNCAKQVQDLL